MIDLCVITVLINFPCKPSLHGGGKGGETYFQPFSNDVIKTQVVVYKPGCNIELNRWSQLNIDSLEMYKLCKSMVLRVHDDVSTKAATVRSISSN